MDKWLLKWAFGPRVFDHEGLKLCGMNRLSGLVTSQGIGGNWTLEVARRLRQGETDFSLQIGHRNP